MVAYSQLITEMKLPKQKDVVDPAFYKDMEKVLKQGRATVFEIMLIRALKMEGAKRETSVQQQMVNFADVPWTDVHKCELSRQFGFEASSRPSGSNGSRMT